MSRGHRPHRMGDAIWAPDAYHTGDPSLGSGGARPWLVLSQPETYPNHGDDYVCCALTSVPPPSHGHVHRIPLEASDWLKGQPRKRTHIDAQTLLTIKHEWVTGFIGEVASHKVGRARRLIRKFF